ncbi:MAG: serine/threonine-protein kinase [Planctomycetota bacterium]|jgi:serine/threonine-protein kinase
MSSAAKQILERAIAQGLITSDQALALGRLRHARKGSEGVAPSVEELAVEKGYLTKEQAARLRTEQEGFALKRQIAGYKLIEKIGAGTMGVVYKAKQLSLDRVVAIKILSPHLSRKSDYMELFLREARAVARLNHPNVISGIDVGETEGIYYFVMEFASGLPISRLLERGGGMAEERVVPVAIQIARALEHANEARLVHRDIKPDNILVTKNGTAKLCDYGLARTKPEKGRPMGTPNYISPEQAKGEEVDIRSDLYSFGATLYHMLAGRPPFEGNANVVMVKHVSEDPKPLRQIDPDISAELEAMVTKLMRKQPAERFQSPKHLLGALEGYGTKRRKREAAPKLQRRTRTRRRRR